MCLRVQGRHFLVEKVNVLQNLDVYLEKDGTLGMGRGSVPWTGGKFPERWLEITYVSAPLEKKKCIKGIPV